MTMLPIANTPSDIRPERIKNTARRIIPIFLVKFMGPSIGAVNQEDNGIILSEPPQPCLKLIPIRMTRTVCGFAFHSFSPLTAS